MSIKKLTIDDEVTLKISDLRNLYLEAKQRMLEEMEVDIAEREEDHYDSLDFGDYLHAVHDIDLVDYDPNCIKTTVDTLFVWYTKTLHWHEDTIITNCMSVDNIHAEETDEIQKETLKEFCKNKDTKIDVEVNELEQGGYELSFKLNDKEYQFDSLYKPTHLINHQLDRIKITK